MLQNNQILSFFKFVCMRCSQVTVMLMTKLQILFQFLDAACEMTVTYEQYYFCNLTVTLIFLIYSFSVSIEELLSVPLKSLTPELVTVRKRIQSNRRQKTFHVKNLGSDTLTGWNKAYCCTYRQWR